MLGPVYTVTRDQVELPNATQIAAWKAMTPGQKYQLVCDCIEFTRNLKRAAIQTANPSWTEDQVDRELARVWLEEALIES